MFRAILGVIFVIVVIAFIGSDEPAERSSSATTPAKSQAPNLTLEQRALRHWNIATGISEIDDRNIVQLSRPSSRKTENSIGLPTTPRLWITCRENSTSISVDWDRFISTQGQSVLVRLDDEPARNHRWSISTDYDHTGLWRGTGIPFIKSMFGKKKMLIQVTPHGASPQRAVFDITGLDVAIRSLRRACNW